MVKRWTIALLAAIATFCSMAQGRSLYHEDKALWVIDGLVMDTLTVAHGEYISITTQ